MMGGAAVARKASLGPLWRSACRPVSGEPAPTTYSEYAWRDARDRGYFADLQEYTVKNGIVTAPMPTVLSRANGIRWPEIPVYDLAELFTTRRTLLDDYEVADRCTLMGLSFRESGRQALQSWLDPFASIPSTRPKQYLELAVVEPAVHRFLVRWLLSRPIRRSLGKPAHPSLAMMKRVFCFDDIISQLKAIGVRNRLAGYIFLIDSHGRVRWRTSGPYCSSRNSNLPDLVQYVADE